MDQGYVCAEGGPMTGIFLVYPNGVTQWKHPLNVKIRGGKLNGVRPIRIHLLNPSELTIDCAYHLLDPTVSRDNVEVTVL